MNNHFLEPPPHDEEWMQDQIAQIEQIEQFAPPPSLAVKESAFLTNLHAMFECLETIQSKGAPMNEGEWILICDQFKKLREVGDTVRTQPLYIEMRRRVERRSAFPRLTKEEMLATCPDAFKVCPNCGQWLKEISQRHLRTSACRHTASIRRASSVHAKTSDERFVRISDNRPMTGSLSILDRVVLLDKKLGTYFNREKGKRALEFIQDRWTKGAKGWLLNSVNFKRERE